MEKLRYVVTLSIVMRQTEKLLIVSKKNSLDLLQDYFLIYVSPVSTSDFLYKITLVMMQTLNDAILFDPNDC